MNRFAFSLFLFTLCFSNGCRSTSHLEVVKDFDIDRYTGVWYEVARYPHRFEEGLTSVTAEYSRNENGTIKVLNRGFSAEKHAWEEAEGIAKFKNDPTRGWLKVSFFGPFFASYKIIHLDDEYSEAIITGPNFDYLWILVRDPAVPAATLERLIQQAALFGFDTNLIQTIDQSMHL